MEGENYMKRKIVCSIMLVCFLCSRQRISS